MKQLLSLALFCAFVFGAEAAWHWPFSSDETPKVPRISELMEPASVMIDEAYDLAADGKTADAVEKYRAALEELDRIEAENPDRVRLPEFNTLKNKRVTVVAAINSLLLSEAKDNARAIAVTDTTDLQRKYDEKHGKQAKERAADPKPREEAAAKVARQAPVAKPRPSGSSPFQGVVACLGRKDYDAAEKALEKILAERPTDVVALNLLAAAQLGKGDAKAAERSLDAAIGANPGDYCAYYNMARLHLGSKGKEASARLYYAAGRKVGGPVDEKLEGIPE